MCTRPVHAPIARVSIRFLTLTVRRHARREHPPKPVAPCATRACAFAPLVLALALFATACHVASPPHVAPGDTVGQLGGLDGPLGLRVVGADGAELDDAAHAVLDDTSPLTLEAAVARAVTTDPGLQVALARVAAARAEADRARLLPNPILSVAWRAGAPGTEFEASFAAAFVAALRRPERASAADHRLRAAAAEAIAAALDVVHEVEERYVDVQTNVALRPLLEERLRLVERLVDVSRARLAAGEGTRGDVVALETQRAALHVEIDRVARDERTGRIRLARRIGVPSDAAAWALEPWRRPFVPDRDERAWIARALATRPEIEARAEDARALDDDAAASDWLAFEGAEIGLGVREDDGLRVGPSLATPMPLADDGDARRRELDARRLAARHAWTRARRDVVEEVRVAHHALVASRASLERIEREWIPLQRERRALAEDAYRAGVTDVTPLILAEEELRRAETQAVEGAAAVARALARLRRATAAPPTLLPHAHDEPQSTRLPGAPDDPTHADAHASDDTRPTETPR